MNKTKTRAVKNKNVAIKLVNAGHELLNITKSYDDGKPCYIFEDTDKFRVEFDEIIKSLPESKTGSKLDNSNCGLTWAERKYLIKLLNGRKSEYQSMGVNVDVIDCIIDKLKYKIDELAASEVADNPNNGRITYIDKGDGLLDRQKLLDMVYDPEQISKSIRDSAVKNMKAMNEKINDLHYPWLDKE